MYYKQTNWKINISFVSFIFQDLQTFLDEGEEGVIYFSLGSNINLNLLTDNFKKAIVEAFAEVPYKVLLKMDGQLNNVSKNVLVRKWMPQQDIFSMYFCCNVHNAYL